MGVVTYPFTFEGRRRSNQAVEGIESLRGAVDSVIVIPNDKLLEVAGEGTPLQEAFSLADDVLRQGVQVGGVGGGGAPLSTPPWQCAFGLPALPCRPHQVTPLLLPPHSPVPRASVTSSPCPASSTSTLPTSAPS